MRRITWKKQALKTSKKKEFLQKQITKGRVRSVDLEIKGLKFCFTKQKEQHFENSQILQKIRLDLSLSDYQAFLLSSKEKKQHSYPEAFRFIRISQHIAKEVDIHSFNPIGCPRSTLIQVSTSIIYRNLFSQQKIDRNVLEELIKRIALEYNIVGYHNFTHGFALMQMLQRCLESDPSLNNRYSSEEVSSYLIAGLAHDINHPGTNNSLEVKRKSSLASMASNESVLQKMHISKLFQVLRENPRWNFIQFCKNPEKMRKNIVEAILATDIAKHFQNLDIFRSKFTQSMGLEEEENQSSFIMGQMFHACDIGNPALDFQQYINWASFLTYQFNEQFKMEDKQGLQVSKFMKFTTISAFLEQQNGFINTFVLPLWKQISLKFPRLGFLVQNIEDNLSQVQAMSEEEKA